MLNQLVLGIPEVDSPGILSYFLKLLPFVITFLYTIFLIYALVLNRFFYRILPDLLVAHIFQLHIEQLIE